MLFLKLSPPYHYYHDPMIMMQPARVTYDLDWACESCHTVTAVAGRGAESVTPSPSRWSIRVSIHSRRHRDLKFSSMDDSDSGLNPIPSQILRMRCRGGGDRALPSARRPLWDAPTPQHEGGGDSLVQREGHSLPGPAGRPGAARPET